jgi:membrane associated rhomboid family serine protease
VSFYEIVTCHFLHWSVHHFVWDAIAFVALGIACARRDLAATLMTLAVAILVIPLAVTAFAPEVAVYRGLSGLDSALFAFLVVQLRSRIAVVFGVAFLAKILFELTTGTAFFATNLGEGIVAVPVAHIAGAIVGAIAATLARCASPSPCSSH